MIRGPRGSDAVRALVRIWRVWEKLEDVANVAEYPAGDLAGFISGQHVLVNGGAPA